MTHPDPTPESTPGPTPELTPDPSAQAEPQRQAPAPQRSSGRSRRRSTHRAIALTVLSAVMPGAGLVRARSRAAATFGFALLAALILALAGVGYLAVTGDLRRRALAAAVNVSTLHAAVFVAAVAGVLWCASIVLTATQSRPAARTRGQTAALATVTGVLVAAVAGAALTVARYAAVTADTVTVVFAGTPATADVQADSANGAGRSVPAHRGSPVVPDAPDPWAQTPRVTILLLGSDSGVGRTGTRTDSMVVASIDTHTGATALISLSRDLEGAPIPASSPLRTLYPSGAYGRPACLRYGGDPCLLNAIWAEADEYEAAHPGAYPGEVSPGRYQTREVISDILGVPIDHTVVVDLAGFQQLVDAMGGVDVNVNLGPSGKLPIGGYQSHTDPTKVVGNTGWFTAGPQHLTGQLALWYVRARATDSDYYRQQRQRCVIKDLVHQVNPAQMLSKYAQIAAIARENIWTDIPAEQLPAYVDLFDKVKSAPFVSVPISPASGIISAHPDYDRVRALVHSAIHPALARAASTAPPTGAPTTAPPATSTATPTTAPAPTPGSPALSGVGPDAC